MNTKRTAILGVVAFACGAISFFDARSTALSGTKSESWLSDVSNSVLALEEEFEQEMAAQIAMLMDEQESLGSALEDPCTPDEVVVKQAEKVIGAHERLMRRAGEQIVKLRGKLSADNREHLMHLCAETVRGPVRRLEGRGSGRGRSDDSGRGYGYGRRGRGRGATGEGYGMRRAIRNRLSNRLELDERQVNLLYREDAEFDTETADLRERLLAERAKLLSMFEDSGSGDSQLLRQIEKLITAHSAIERRVVRHVLVLRPYLTGEQQKWLIGLCRRNHAKSPPAEDLNPSG
jgi:hypothetical protein